MTISKQEQQNKGESRKAFLQQFEKLCFEKIKPIMEDTGNTLKANGHDFEIYYRKEHKNEKGILLNSIIKMNVFSHGKQLVNIDNSTTYIMFFAEKK